MLRELKEATMVRVNQSFFNMKYLQTFSLSCEKNNFCFFGPIKKDKPLKFKQNKLREQQVNNQLNIFMDVCVEFIQRASLQPCRKQT